MSNCSSKSACAVALLVALAGLGYSQEIKPADSTHKIVRSGNLKWTPIIKGCEIAVIEGNLDSEGQPFVARFHCNGIGPFKVNWVNPSEVQPPDAPPATTPKR
jgi:hypothetical protein